MVLLPRCLKRPVSGSVLVVACCCSPPDTWIVPRTLDCTHAGGALSDPRPAGGGHNDWAVVVTAGLLFSACYDSH